MPSDAPSVPPPPRAHGMSLSELYNQPATYGTLFVALSLVLGVVLFLHNALTSRFDRTDVRIDRVEARLERVEHELGELKTSVAVLATEMRALREDFRAESQRTRDAMGELRAVVESLKAALPKRP